MKVQGQCHCGAIAFEADVEPGTIQVCHCEDCQQQSGSAFRANVPTSAEHFRLVRGEPHTYLKTATSGAQRVHAFCANCGGPIYATNAGVPQRFSLRLGTIRQRDQLGRPARQIWTRRRLAWVTCIDDGDMFDGQP